MGCAPAGFTATGAATTLGKRDLRAHNDSYQRRRGLAALFRRGDGSVDSSSEYSSSWDAAHEEPEADIVAHWPDGTAITEAQLRAPADPRELISDRRRYRRERRWARRRSRIGRALRRLGSPRGVIAALLATALLAASLIGALGAVR